MDLTASIQPRSDQINAEDLLTGPRTVTIVAVVEGSSDQPVSIVTEEYGRSRPYKPSKTQRRILVSAWGPDSNAYSGRRMTIFRDPSIRFGKDEVGGIRISHLSHIDRPLRLMLTTTRGKRSLFVVEPLPTDANAAPLANPLNDLGRAFEQANLANPEARHAYCENVVGHGLAQAADLTPDEITAVIAALRDDAAELPMGAE